MFYHAIPVFLDGFPYLIIYIFVESWIVLSGLTCFDLYFVEISGSSSGMGLLVLSLQHVFDCYFGIFPYFAAYMYIWDWPIMTSLGKRTSKYRVRWGDGRTGSRRGGLALDSGYVLGWFLAIIFWKSDAILKNMNNPWGIIRNDQARRLLRDCIVILN